MSAPLLPSATIVDSIAKIVPSDVGTFQTPVGPLTVTFAGGETAILPPSAANYSIYAAILTELKALRMPVYVTTGSEGQITKVLIPSVGFVVALVRRGDEVGFRLDSSAQAFTLEQQTTGSASLVKVLQDAQIDHSPVMVVQDEMSQAILDIKPAGPPSPVATEPPVPTRPAISIPTVTMKKASELFELVAQKACDPANLSQGCIPFLYLRDGCHVRAHEMCRLLMNAGAQPGKVWNYSTRLKVDTPNEPGCRVFWGFHVAPTLRVSNGAHDFHLQVLDPSLFPKPVSVPDWRSPQGDSRSILIHTAADPFLPPAPGDIEIDPDFSTTQRQLSIYRLQLQLRLLQLGAPPYCREKSESAGA